MLSGLTSAYAIAWFEQCAARDTEQALTCMDCVAFTVQIIEGEQRLFRDLLDSGGSEDLVRSLVPEIDQVRAKGLRGDTQMEPMPAFVQEALYQRNAVFVPRMGPVRVPQKQHGVEFHGHAVEHGR